MKTITAIPVRTTRAAAIVIGLIMIFSMLGFALYNVVPEQNAQYTIPSVIDRVLTPNEKIYILRTGRVLIQALYPENCSECAQCSQLLQSFVKGFEDYAVLELAAANETTFQIIGQAGRINNFQLNITESELFDLFCELAILQPKECLLKEL